MALVHQHYDREHIRAEISSSLRKLCSPQLAYLIMPKVYINITSRYDSCEKRICIGCYTPSDGGVATILTKSTYATSPHTMLTRDELQNITVMLRMLHG